MSEELFRFRTKEGEDRLTEIQEILEEDFDAAKLLRGEIRDELITILKETDVVSESMYRRVDAIINKIGIPVREIGDALVGVEDSDEGGEDYWYEDFMEGFDDPAEESSDVATTEPIQTLPGPFLPPDEAGTRSASSFEFLTPYWSRGEHPRIRLLQQVLTEMGISIEPAHGELLEYKENGVDPDKKSPYKIFAVPKLGKLIMISDKDGNATYVVRTNLEDVEKYVTMTKGQLKDHGLSEGNVDFLPWKNGGQWRQVLRKVLIAKSPLAYFRSENAERIKEELMAFAAQIGGGIDPKELLNWSFPGVTIVDRDGAEHMGYEYIERAAIELGFSTTNAKIPRYSVLEKLLKLAGIT